MLILFAALVVTVQSLAAVRFLLTHLQQQSSTDPAMIPRAMNNAWDPGTDYPYQFAILITLAKLPLNSYEYVDNVWDPYSPPLVLTSFFFFYLEWVWKHFENITQVSHSL